MTNELCAENGKADSLGLPCNTQVPYDDNHSPEREGVMSAAAAMAPVRPSYKYRGEPVEVLEEVTPTLWKIRTSNDDEFCVKAEKLKEVRQRKKAEPAVESWSSEYELLFEKLAEYGCLIEVCVTDHFISEFIDFYEQLTGVTLDPLAPIPGFYPYDTISTSHAQTSYQIIFSADVVPYVPAGHAVGDHQGRTVMQYRFTCKSVAMELLRRGFRLGSNKGTITQESFPDVEQSSMVGLPLAAPSANLTQSDVDAS